MNAIELTAKSAGYTTAECARPRAQRGPTVLARAYFPMLFGIVTLLRPRTGALRLCLPSRRLLSRLKEGLHHKRGGGSQKGLENHSQFAQGPQPAPPFALLSSRVLEAPAL